MDNPKTSLDDRFSDPGTQPTSWADTERALETAQISWISTVRPDGRPHVTPLVAVWLDGALHFSTGDQEQKGLNVAANPNVTLTTGTNSWDDALDVVVEGVARRVTDRETLGRLAAAWRMKWDGCWQFDVSETGFDNSGHQAVVYAVEPTKVLAFGRREPVSSDGMLSSVAFTHTCHLNSSR
jgi:general stress protein 26